MKNKVIDEEYIKLQQELKYEQEDLIFMLKKVKKLRLLSQHNKIKEPISDFFKKRCPVCNNILSKKQYYDTINYDTVYITHYYCTKCDYEYAK